MNWDFTILIEGLFFRDFVFSCHSLHPPKSLLASPQSSFECRSKPSKIQCFRHQTNKIISWKRCSRIPWQYWKLLRPRLRDARGRWHHFEVRIRIMFEENLVFRNLSSHLAIPEVKEIRNRFRMWTKIRNCKRQCNRHPNYQVYDYSQSSPKGCLSRMQWQWTNPVQEWHHWWKWWCRCCKKNSWNWHRIFPTKKRIMKAKTSFLVKTTWLLILMGENLLFMFSLSKRCLYVFSLVK